MPVSFRTLFAQWWRSLAQLSQDKFLLHFITLYLVRFVHVPEFHRLQIYNASFGWWALNVLRVIYLINLTGQKQYVTEVTWIWPIIVSGDSPEIIFSPDLKPHDYQINYVNIDLSYQDSAMKFFWQKRRGLNHQTSPAQ